MKSNTSIPSWWSNHWESQKTQLTSPLHVFSTSQPTDMPIFLCLPSMATVLPVMLSHVAFDNIQAFTIQVGNNSHSNLSHTNTCTLHSCSWLLHWNSCPRKAQKLLQTDTTCKLWVFICYCQKLTTNSDCSTVEYEMNQEWVFVHLQNHTRQFKQ